MHMQTLKLKELRNAKGLSQQQLADKLNKDRSVISRYESGELDMPVSVLYEIAQILKVPINKLFQN